MKKIVSVLFFFAGCIPPMAGHETGRTLGESQSELIGGLGAFGHVIKYNYGVTDYLDLGIHWETFSLGLRAKYSFINTPISGWSLAGALGAGSVSHGRYITGDVIGSYLSGDWEPYGFIRRSRVICNEVAAKDSKKLLHDFLVACEKKHYDRVQFTLGSKYWFSAKWFLSLETGRVFENSIAPVSILSTSFGYKF